MQASTRRPEQTRNSTKYDPAICLANDDFREEHNHPYKTNNEEENFDPNALPIKTEPPGVTKSKLKDRRSLMKRQGSSRRRRRRRSSARFLKIVPDDDDDECGDGEGIKYDGNSTANLGEVYRNAIRMNAENRINASNSWNLNLIDHLDRFVAPELRHGTGGGNGERPMKAMKGGIASRTYGTNIDTIESTMDTTLTSGVNFTKASCTLDASVKIYSYRVDDVHLTSYKVLANLNRTDNNTSCNGKRKNSANSSIDKNDNLMEDAAKESSLRTIKSGANANAIDTLEQNTANINIHKLDAAFDIDPLFHKMSKTFDEGGAKGLLLANLGVGISGCNIIFDSTLDDEGVLTASLTTENEDVGSEENAVLQPAEGVTTKNDKTMNINSTTDVKDLVGKLTSLLSNASGNFNTIKTMPLVPQLALLRDQYTELGNCGFVEEVGKSSKRYASSLDDETEADRSIHIEAIERSRVSQADLGRSHIHRGSVGSCFGSHGDDNYGESEFDFGGEDDDAFGDLHDGDHRFSSSSFAPARVSLSTLGNVDDNLHSTHNNVNTTVESRDSFRPVYSQASAVLDAIASGDISTLQHNHYEYFNRQALKNLSSENLWAGAEHWKKLPSRRRRMDGAGVENNIRRSQGSSVRDESLTKSKKKKGVKGKTKSTSTPSTLLLVSISKPILNLEALLEKPKSKRGKNVADPLQLTKAMRTKYGNNNNLLPMDAGLGVKEFTTLFSRPKINVMDLIKEKRDKADRLNLDGKPAKVVGFCGVETWETDDASAPGLDFGGSDDGYDENDNLNDFMVPTLEDVRKVDKIKIGYATVARKVDVKRLKRDLWTELEQTFSSGEQNNVLGATLGEDRKDDTEILSTAAAFSDLDLRCNVGENDENDRKDEMDNHVTALSFQETVRDMQTNQSQSDVTLPFYFICVLHLCNEKGLALESSGLDDFIIRSS